jgi:1-acyl-sn-glycerol-3-phosphate acyltransferase
VAGEQHGEAPEGETREELLARAKVRGVNKPFYWLARAILEPPARVYFRFRGIGRKNIPKKGGVIVALNHRSFLDPFLIVGLTRRQAFFVAKRELFEKPGLYGRVARWFISNLGAFPIDRGVGDEESMATARELIERGEVVMIFPEGTRVRPGPLGHPRSGVGRLALETGAPVVPVAVFGTENVRRGWRIYPRKITIRAGKPMTFPKTEHPDRELAAAVTSRIWPQVELLWESFGGTAPLRRAAVVGAGAWGTALAVTLRRSGLEVALGARTAEEAELISGAGANERYLPGYELEPGTDVVPAEDINLTHIDVVLLAVPAGDLPAAVGELAPRIGPDTGIVVMSKGLVLESGQTPTTFCGERLAGHPVACLGGPAHSDDSLDHGASVVVAGEAPVFVAQLRRAFADAGFDVEASRDVAGVELAGIAVNVAVLAGMTAAVAGPNAAGAAAGKVFSEVARYSEGLGASAESWTGLAGAGDLIASVLAEGGRNRRAGELLGEGLPAEQVREELGQVAEALESVGPLADAIEAAGGRCPALRALAGVVDGSFEAGAFARSVTEPRRIVGARVV